MTSKIIKGIAGFYYCVGDEGVVYECKAKGVFRNEKMKPLVGDDVEIVILDAENHKGNIVEILPRRNELVRPNVANVDGALVIFAVKQPEPNLNLLDRFLIMMEQRDLPCAICFNKEDMITEAEKKQFASVYGGTDYPIFHTSARNRSGVEELVEFMRGKTWVVAGPSGVGKSSLINCLQDHTVVLTGEISHRNERGKHTTRHSEIYPVDSNTYIMDTPGFTLLDVFSVEKESLRFYYPEFDAYEGTWRYVGCTHIHEPGCSVQEAVAAGKINQIRYENYRIIFQELMNKRRY